jgi:hypothetical protein
VDIFFERFLKAFKAMDDDKIQLSFLLHDLVIFFKRSGLLPSQKSSNLTGTGNGKEGMHFIWSASLAEELGLNLDLQNVILYRYNRDPLKGKNKNTESKTRHTIDESCRDLSNHKT